MDVLEAIVVRRHALILLWNSTSSWVSAMNASSSET
jgi:hypothetical protein